MVYMEYDCGGKWVVRYVNNFNNSKENYTFTINGKKFHQYFINKNDDILKSVLCEDI